MKKHRSPCDINTTQITCESIPKWDEQSAPHLGRQGGSNIGSLYVYRNSEGEEILRIEGGGLPPREYVVEPSENDILQTLERAGIFPKPPGCT